MTKRDAFLFPPVIIATMLLGACLAQETRKQMSGPQPGSGAGENPSAEVLDLRTAAPLGSIIPDLLDSRVVYVGETHDRYGHHMNQLEIIQALHRSSLDMAIGMEFFQQSFQEVLDGYISGDLNEREMLVGTEWYDRWRYDYRLYRPILQYARENRIPVVALNVPMELTARVSEVGLSGLTREEKQRLPEAFDFSDQAYTERLKIVFEKHAHSETAGFERFMEVQLTWDEGMADTISRYLQQHPQRRMVVLAGSGHLMFGSGIPQRVRRRIDAETTIVLPADDLSVEPGIADFVVFGRPAELPEAGMMGVFMGIQEEGVVVSDLVSEGAADQAGLEKGDVILRLDGHPVATTADVRIGMLGKRPGEQVQVQVLRKPLLRREQTLTLDLVLQP